MEYKITLLSREEYLEHKSVIPLIEEPWWLRTPGDKNYSVCSVHGIGGLYTVYVNNYIGVRPTLLINEPEKVYKYGSEISVGKYKWTVLRSDEKECYVLCTEIVATRRYDVNSNDYETSEIKRWLENDFQWFDFCKYCFDCTCDPDGELTPENDYSSCSIGNSTNRHRIMFSAGWGKPPRIEFDIWDENIKKWVTVSSYTPEYCPNCGRKINKEAYKR